MKPVQRHLDTPSTESPAMPARVAVILLHVGGPDDRDDIERFYTDLWADPAVVPRSVTAPFRGKRSASAFAAARDELVMAYERIGGRSPVADLLAAQALALQNRLCGRPLMAAPAAGPVRAFVGLRYGRPSIAQAVADAVRSGAERIVGLPAYPLYDDSLGGLCLAELKSACAAAGVLDRLSVVESFADSPGWIAAMIDRTRRSFDLIPPDLRGSAFLLFSLLSPPAGRASAGPLFGQAEAAAQAIMRGVGLTEERSAVAYQNVGGPGNWLDPGLVEAALERVKAGVEALVVVPLSFVTDGFETLHVLDNDLYMETARLNLKQYRRVPTLNADPAFIDSLGRLVLDRLPEEARRTLACSSIQE